MKKLIPSKNNSIEPNGVIGVQKCGIVFWQKTGFLRHCNRLGFKTIITLISKKFKPTSSKCYENECFITFGNDEEIIYLSLKKDKNSNHYFIYGESHTVYANLEFHLLVLEIISFIAKNIGTCFFVDDATSFIEHKSKEKLAEYIENFKL